MVVFPDFFDRPRSEVRVRVCGTPCSIAGVEVDVDTADPHSLPLSPLAEDVPHHAVDQGLFRADDIHATLGEILAGQKNGRTSDDEITLLDATGLAFQDLVAGALAVKLAA